MDAESITETVVKPLDLSMGIYDYDAERLDLAFRKLFEDIGLDRVIRKRLRKALVFKYDSLNQNVL